MTRTLYFLRHAKSDWTAPETADHDRALAPRGIHAGKVMAQEFKREKFSVDRVYCSTARRARETFDLISLAIKFKAVTYRRQLYLIDNDDLVMMIQKLPKNVESALIIGHNPGLHITALDLLSTDQPKKKRMMARLLKKYPTGTLCGIKFDVKSWDKIELNTGKLIVFRRPRDLDKA